MSDRIKRLVAALDLWAGRRRSTRIIRGALVGFVAHEALQYAGAMAYFLILSIANLLVLAVVGTSFLLGEGAARRFVIEQVTTGVPLSAKQVTDLIDRAVEARGGVTIVGLVLLLWSALGVFGALSNGISRVFTGAPHRAFWKDRLIGLLLLAATGMLAVASFVLGLLTQIIEEAVSAQLTLPGMTALFAVVAFLVPMALVFVAFLIVYRVIPTRPIAFGDAMPGALVATVLWSALRIGFTFYATKIARYDSVFGPIGTGITLLVFLYFSSVILLLGAEVARASAMEADPARTPPREAVVEPAEAPSDAPG